MNTLNQHYAALLGLSDPWQVDDIELTIDPARVIIRVAYAAERPCPCAKCGQSCTIYDHAAERTWRHLDTMQFETIIVARVPRANCPQCGVANINIPWAEPLGRFTLMFAAFAIKVIQAASSIDKARLLLRLSWASTHAIMKAAVERGIERRNLDNIKSVGVDEKSFGSGQNYVTVVCDIEERRVIEVAEGRDEAAAKQALAILSDQQKDEVQAVAIDMSAALIHCAGTELPNAEVVHDRFHISKHLSDAVDKVRRQEHRNLSAKGNSLLTGSKYLWLRNPDTLAEDQIEQLRGLRQADLKTARAWALRENFRTFWTYRRAGWAIKFFEQWYSWAIRSRLDPMIKVAKMIKRHLPNIVTWFKHRISNGLAEGFNSVIQSLKTAARGFRNFVNYRLRILFACGRLRMSPVADPTNSDP